MIFKWSNIVQKLRIHPGAVCRQLLTNLKIHETLTESEECRLIRAIENSGVEDATNRLLAHLSRNTINAMLNKI